MRIFPRWAKLLGLDAKVVGRDIALRAEPAAFRAAVAEIAAGRGLRGALVTTHKVDVYAHAGDLFDELDRYARMCREVSCISKRGGRLVGRATDPITAGRVLEAMVDRDHWAATGAHVLCLGAGGAGTAIAVRLLEDPQPPERIIVTDTDPDRIDALGSTVGALPGCERVEGRAVSSREESDALLASLPEGSLVVNATGLGKDLPGSPLTGRASFPRQSIVWELNYRGDLDFLRQARGQAGERELVVHDGWLYFLHGWSEVLAEVFELSIDEDLFVQLGKEAALDRPG